MFKKIKVSSILIILGLFLSSCVGNLSSSKDIELNLGNYDDYLEISASFGGERSTRYWASGFSEYWYPEVVGSVRVSAASRNFDYNNVEIYIRVIGEFNNDGVRRETNFDGKYDEIIPVDLNIGGSGSGQVVVKVSSIARYQYAINPRGVGYEVVGVTGTVRRLSD